MAVLGVNITEISNTSQSPNFYFNFFSLLEHIETNTLNPVDY